MRCARWISLSLACLLMGACTSTETATECGNGVKQGSEECDGEDLGHMSCSDFIGLAYGRLGCTLDCRFDTSGCIPVDKECSRDADCDRFAGEGEKLCCAEVDPGFSICVEIDPNYACGDGTGGCGASCTGKSHSACLPGHPCLADSLDDPNAICSHQCVTDADCRDCELDEIEFSCQAISGGDKYCLDAAGQACSRHADCPGGEVCMVDVVDGLLRGTCGRQGALDPGAECDDEDEPDDLPYEERCAALYCFYGFCSEVCTLDSDCPEGMTCERVGFIELPDQTIDMCFGYDHGWPGGPGDPCIFGSVNADSEYCQRGLACLGYDPEQLGEPCERDADCLEVLPPAQNPDCTAEGLCGASFCSPRCNENECEEGFYPAQVGDDCYCIPREIGRAGPGDPCPHSGANRDADYCQSGLECLGVYPVQLTTLCTSDADCMDVMPPAQNPDCTADGICGASFCAPPCDENAECEPGFYPARVGNDCYCIPQEIGSSGPGDPCPFQGVHADADDCQAGLLCLGIYPDGHTTLCETDVDCMDVFPPAENPACSDEGLCGESFCSAFCDENNQCEPGFYPAVVGEDCYCIPE